MEDGPAVSEDLVNFFELEVVGLGEEEINAYKSRSDVVPRNGVWEESCTYMAR